MKNPTHPTARPRHPEAGAWLLLAAAALLSCPTVSAAVAVTKNAPVPVFSDGYGFNTRFPDTADPWEWNSDFWTLAFGDTFGGCVRYPGGTVGNFWNANTNQLFSKKTSVRYSAKKLHRLAR